MKFEAGVNAITWPYKPRWTGITVNAKTKEEAENIFAEKGFYRNLVVSEVEQQ